MTNLQTSLTCDKECRSVRANPRPVKPKNPRPIRVDARDSCPRNLIRVYPRRSATRGARKNPRPLRAAPRLVTKKPDPASIRRQSATREARKNPRPSAPIRDSCPEPKPSVSAANPRLVKPEKIRGPSASIRT